MDTDNGIKLVKELKQNKLLPKFNVSSAPKLSFSSDLRQEELLNEMSKQILGQYVYLTEDFA